MREFLNETHERINDGVGRVRAADKKELPKRFYTEVSVSEQGVLFGVQLDKRATKTPSKTPVLVPSRELAQLLADEWRAQGTYIDAAAMPAVRLVNSAVEGGAKTAGALRQEVIKYAGNDLMLYRADGPEELVELQERHWDSVLADIARHFDVKFRPVTGIIHKDQPKNTLARLARSLAAADHFALTALVFITSLTGSGLLAVALRHGLIDAGAAWAAAQIDEDYNAALWGADHEALERLEKRRIEFDAALRVLAVVDRV